LAKKFFKKVHDGSEKAEISILVVDEVIYVLNRFYQIERSNFIPELLKIFSMRGISILEINKDIIIEILNKMIGNKIDFTDYYLASLAPKSQIFTFDRDFKKI